MPDHYLHRHFLANAGKGLHKWVHYFDIYEHHFERFRDLSPTVLEIGVAAGGSLQMWQGYFGSGCRIVGLDVEPKCERHRADGIDIFIGSQDDPAVIDSICEKYGAIDIVIDDGSHRSEHMIASFEALYKRMSPNGVYLVEDCYTCYSPAYGMGLKAPASFIEYAKDKIDEINAAHNELPVSLLTCSTRSISFYDSIVVFERAPQGVRQHPATVGMSARRSMRDVRSMRSRRRDGAERKSRPSE